MNLRKQTARGVLWSFVQNIGARSISFLVFMVLVRLLEPEAFGIVALSLVYLAFIELFLNIGFGAAIIQRRELEPGHLDTAFWIILVIGIAATAASIAASELIAEFFEQPELAPIIRWMSISITFVSLTRVQVAKLKREMKFRELALRTLIGSLIGGIVGIGMALNGYGVWSLVGQQLSSALSAVIVLWTVSGWVPGFKLSLQRGRELFGFGIHVLGSNAMDFLSQQADRILVGYFLGATELGIYVIALRIIEIIRDLMGKSLSTVLYSTFSVLQNNADIFRTIYLSTTQLAVIIAFPIFAFLAAAGPEIVPVLFGTKWEKSIIIIQLLSVVAMVQSVTVFNDIVFKAMGRPELSFKAGLIRVFIGVTLISIAVHWGIQAVAVAKVLQMTIVVLIVIVWVKSLLNLNLLQFIMHFRTALIAATVMALYVYSIRILLPSLQTQLVLLAQIAGAALIYPGIVYRIEPEPIRRLIKLGRKALPGNR